MKQSPFRSIRHKLFNEGKLLRYLGYAVGEIALIIIGIMLALQLNNWNEDRKAQVEFDAYIVQLREDVKRAIENVERAVRITEGFQKDCEFIPSFLEMSEYGIDDLEKFENGISNLGNYSEIQVHVGLLGQLMNGNMDIIGRNRVMAQKALKMESSIERQLDSLSHIYNQIDLDASSLNQFRGKGSNRMEVLTKYDLEHLKSSAEFIYTSHTITTRLRTAVGFSSAIARNLEDFLTVLEEYE